MERVELLEFTNSSGPSEVRRHVWGAPKFGGLVVDPYLSKRYLVVPVSSTLKPTSIGGVPLSIQ